MLTFFQFLGKTALFFVLTFTQVLAQEVAEKDIQIEPFSSTPLTTASVAQLLFGLGLVLAIIFLLMWLMRKFSFLPHQNKNIKVISALALGSKEKAVLIQVGNEQLLLGVTPQHVNLIKVFDLPVVEATEPVSFKASLDQWRKKALHE